MVDGESPVTQVWLLIAGVLTHQVENILEGLEMREEVRASCLRFTDIVLI